jgi:hypothetical protein
VRLQVLTAANMKKRAFWDIAPCSLVGTDRRFRGAYYLHHEGDGGNTLQDVISQKAHILRLSSFEYNTLTILLEQLSNITRNVEVAEV